MIKWLKENWFKLSIVFIFIILAIVVICSEREITTLNKWNKLCSNISTRELQIRRSLDIKMGDREKEWCKNAFYKFFK